MTIKMDSFLTDLQNLQEVYWKNPNYEKDTTEYFNLEDIIDASNRLDRFAPFIETVFPETKLTKGIIESELAKIPNLLTILKEKEEFKTNAKLYLKCDNNLPISGSIKARGGIYEVLKLAETIALESGTLTLEDNYAKLTEKEFTNMFQKYAIAVGSTGNLGLSIGIMGAKIGFKTTVHMSNDAKQWKKDLLRERGVQVIEHEGDFSKAVNLGREAAEKDPTCHFVDDEGSRDLFLGYSVAALRLKEQLKEQHITVSKENPLFVYLPCGVGGSPGGVAFGLNTIFGANVKIIFVEPTHAPSMLLGLYTGLNDGISVNDIGIDGKTAADGLAVGRPSRLVGNVIDSILYAATTVKDERLFKYLTLLADSEAIFVEPSSAAGIASFVDINKRMGEQEPFIRTGTHIIWGTGGNMVPESEMASYYHLGKSII